MGKYNPIVMGEMLSAAFNNTELQSLAFNLDINLPDEISHLGKSGKVIDIVKYAVNRGVDDQVVSYVEENNSYQYEQFKPRLLTPLNASPSVLEDSSIQRSSTTINTGGGTYADGNVTTGGDFIGRDQIVHNYHSNTNATEIKEIREGISLIMQELDELNDRNPIVQEITNNNQTYNITDNKGIVNFGNIEKIDNSFNTVSNSDAADELKQILNVFLEEIKTLSNNPPAGKEEDVDTIVKNGERLVEEASSAKPSKPWLNLSLDELKKAATNIGDLAGPIVLAAGKIITALGITL
ncbi:MAG: hypothetical protein AAF902_13240 [Chloroflexota bacterium]